MDLGRGRTVDGRAEAARRRLELLEVQIAADARKRHPDPPLHDRPAAPDDGSSLPGSTVTDPAGLADPQPQPVHHDAGSGEVRDGGRHRAPRLSRRRRWAGDVHDRLPHRWRSVLGRGLTPHHVVVVLVLAAAGVSLTVWWVVSARPSSVTPISAPSAGPPEEAAAATPATAPGAAHDPSVPTPAAAKTSSGTVVVDVSGKVRKPGIVSLPSGSRVADALDAAGGARHGADLDTLNLARVLSDGEQIVVGLPAVGSVASPDGSTGANGPAAAPVNLNTATVEQLETLPGVGPVTANAIIDWRTDHGHFSTVDELLEVDGIGEATLADLRDLVTV